jgi:malonate-semialdehyde dehydrogenase (acetylating)/methylmalonate-semialdehyde dehydrogenase
VRVRAGFVCFSMCLVDEDGLSERNDDLLKQVLEVASKLQPGQAGGQVGPLIDGIAQQRVLTYIDESEAHGAQILLDGRSWAKTNPKGFWMGPTIILHQNQTDRALLDEIFGPVLSIVRVNHRDDAIEMENKNPYGNAACIYTEKGANAEWFTRRFRAGMLGINIGIPVPREPFSFGGLYGTKSKYGNTDITGDGALEFFSNRIKITSKWSASYGSSSSATKKTGSSAADDSHPAKKPKMEIHDKANFDGRM